MSDNWKIKLENFFEKENQRHKEIVEYIEDVVVPAFKAVSKAMDENNRNVNIEIEKDRLGEEQVSIQIGRDYAKNPIVELEFTIVFDDKKPIAKITYKNKGSRDIEFQSSDYTFKNVSKEQIIRHIVDEYITQGDNNNDGLVFV